MLEEITWKEFGVAVAAVAAVWYVLVGMVYYREELTGLVKKRKTSAYPTEEKEQAGMGDGERGAGDEEEEDSSFAELEMIVMGLRHGILEKAGRGADKQALLTQLKQELSGYKGLTKPAFRIAINNFIITNGKEICGVAFSEDELEDAWDGLPR